MIWVIPAAVFAVLAVPVVLAVRRCVAEAAALGRSLSALSELVPAARELQADVAQLRAGIPLVRDRPRPGLPAGS